MNGHPFSTDGQALTWRLGHQTLRVEPWGQDAVRVRATLEPDFRPEVWALTEHPADDRQPVAIRLDHDGASLRQGALRVDVSPGGELAFFRGDQQQPLLAEPRNPPPPARRFRSRQGGLYEIAQRFTAVAGERFYGLGQQPDGQWDRKGSVVPLEQTNCHTTIPFALSSLGYGLLWNSPAVGQVELATSGTCWRADAAWQIDYWVVAGESPAAILARYYEVTGMPAALPDFALGFWQSRLRYASQQELLTVAREYRRRELPLAMIVIDYYHWPVMGAWCFDAEAWPDPAAMVRELHELGIEVMVSTWPTINPLAPTWGEARDRGFLVRTERGAPAQKDATDTNVDGRILVQAYDATNPEARAWFCERLRDGYLRHGLRHFWLDCDEPDWFPHYDHDHLRYHLGNGAAVANVYPHLHAEGVCEGLRGAGARDFVLLSRAAWAGSQRFPMVVWSGDVPSTFDALRRQVRAGLHMALSGIPWWTTDVGGFVGGHVEDPAFRELVVRWFQYGVFCPILRLHGVRQPGDFKLGAPNEVWSFGDEVYAILCEQLALRERLRPYLRELLAEVTRTGLPPMRPLLLEFPDDPAAWEVGDQFLLGPDVLVAPVTVLGARERRVYFPTGATWRDAWTGETVPGGECRHVPAPLERLPVFLRDNARWPLRSA